MSEAALAARARRRSTCTSTGSLLAVLPEDADARDAAEAAAWYLGDERVAFFPSRGVRWESGLEPPPHLVGERARALDVLAAGGLVCASATAIAELAPPPAARPGTARSRGGRRAGDRRGRGARSRSRATSASSGSRSAGSSPSAAGSSTSSRPPAASRSGSTSSATRSRRSARSRRSRSARSGRSARRGSTRPPSAGPTSPSRRSSTRASRRRCRTTSCPRSTAPPTSSSSRTRCAGCGPTRGSTRARSRRRGAARPVPAGAGARVRGAAARGRRARARRGRAGARVVRPRRPARGRRVPAPRRRTPHGEPAAHASPPSWLEPGGELPDAEGLYFTVSPARRGFVWRDLGLVLLPDTQIFRKKAPRHDARLGRALQSFADLRTGDYVVHEDHGVGKLLGFETKEVAGVTRDYLFLAFRGDDRLYVPHEQIGKVSRYIGADAKAPALSKLGGKAWQLLKSRARESVAGARRRADRALRAPPDRAGCRLRPLERLAGAARGRVPLPRDGGPAARDRGGQGGPRGAEPDGPPRLRRRRLRQDRGRAACRVLGRAERQADADARPDDRARAAALEHVPRALPRLPRAGRDGLALPQAGRREGGAEGLRRGQGRRPRRHAPRPLARRDPEEPRARDRRRGAALRRAAEGAPALAAARGRRARDDGDADPAHAAHVALGPAGHLRDRDAARGPPADPHPRRRVRRGADQERARAREGARRPVVLPPQPRRDDRGGRNQDPGALPRPPHRRSRTAR